MPTVHGVFLLIDTTGTLITGPAGIGKSELALELIDRGHRLIADDAPDFETANDGQIIGRCPPLLQDFLEIRDLGVLNIRRLFGSRAICHRQPLELVIELKPRDRGDNSEATLLFGDCGVTEICDRPIPTVRLTPRPGRNLAILVETSIRNHLLRRKGYNSAEDFQCRLQKELDAGVSMRCCGTCRQRSEKSKSRPATRAQGK